MTIEQAMRDYLTEAVLIRTHCMVFPDDVTFPAIRMQRIGGAPMVDLSGDSGEERARIQVSCYAKTYSEAKSLAVDVKDALSAVSGAMGEIPNCRTFITNETDLYEAESRLHHVALDVDVLATIP
jgi:hypothetical protein